MIGCFILKYLKLQEDLLWILNYSFQNANLILFLFIFSRIQDSDGGFFEKFGQLLHQRNEHHDETVLGSSALVDQDAASFLAKNGEVQVELESRFAAIDEEGDTGKDSGNESIADDSDSEEKKEESMKDIRNALVGMNVSIINIITY